MNFLLQYKPNKLKIYTKVSEASRSALSEMSAYQHKKYIYFSFKNKPKCVKCFQNIAKMCSLL